jgi:long-subunit fatty acid transport protein
VRRLAFSFGLLLVFALPAGRASAFPMLAPRPVPSAIAGPADPHVAAVFYNPAALGPLRGVHVYFDGAARLHEGSIERTDPQSGTQKSAPINWADFDAFGGLSWDLNTDSFTIGLAAFTPFTDLTAFGDQSPARYHAIHHTMVVFEQTAAAAFKVSSRFYIGAAANFAEQWIDYRFSRDSALQGGSALVNQPNALCAGAACGFENPLAEQRLRLRGFNWGIGFSVGVLVRPIDRLWLGLTYISHIFNTGRGGDFPLSDDRRAEVQTAPGLPQPAGQVCPDLSYRSNTCRGNDRVTVAIPDMILFATRVEVNPTFDLEASARWVHYGTRSNYDVSLQGGNLSAINGNRLSSVPQQFYLDRGFQDAFGFEVSGRWRVGEKLRISPSLFFETSAVDASAVNAAAIDAPKFDLALTTEWKPIKHLTIGAHVGGTTYVLSDVRSRFDPSAEVACVDARYSLDACGASNRGQGLPSADGKYTYFVVHLGAAIGMDY